MALAFPASTVMGSSILTLPSSRSTVVEESPMADPEPPVFGTAAGLGVAVGSGAAVGPGVAEGAGVAEGPGLGSVSGSGSGSGSG